MVCPWAAPLVPHLPIYFFLITNPNGYLNVPPQFQPLLYKRYVDDLLIIFRHQSLAPLFLEYLNKQHNNIKFTLETETNNSLPFLDILITHKDNTFTTSIHRKPTNTWLGMNFYSFIHKKFIMSPINTYIFRAYKISSTWSLFHLETTFLKKFFSFNSYPPYIIDKYIHKFINHIINPPSHIFYCTFTQFIHKNSIFR